MTLNIKTIFKITVAAIIAILVATVTIESSRIRKLNSELSQSINNIKAFELENSRLKDSSLVFKYTIQQLNTSIDSTVQKMNDIRKQLRVKDKNISRLEYLLSTASRADTLYITTKDIDTIFVKEMPKIDTTIQDADGWYKCQLGLEYPNKISIKPEFKSEKYIISSAKKETIKPPKKCKLARLFQKKHTVIAVTVEEKNPYIINQQQKFIEIVK